MQWEVMVWGGGNEGIQAQGVVVMTMTWVWTDGVQLMMNNYARFFFFFLNIVVLSLPPPVVKIVTSPLISWCLAKNKKWLWWMETKWCCGESCSPWKQHSPPQAGSLPFCNTCSTGHMYLIFHGWLFAALPSAANGTVLACARCINGFKRTL